MDFLANPIRIKTKWTYNKTSVVSQIFQYLNNKDFNCTVCHEVVDWNKWCWAHHFKANRWGKKTKQNNMDTVTDFIFLGSIIMADSDCSHEIKRHLLLGRNAMTNLDSIFKSRDVTLPTKVCVVKAMVSPAVLYACESWAIKKAEHQRIDVFTVVVQNAQSFEKTPGENRGWRRLLRVPWTARRLNQSILKEINPEYSLEGLILKLKFQYLATWCEETTHWKRPSCWKRLKAGGEGDERRWDGWMALLIQWTWSLSKFLELVKDREAWRVAVHWAAKSWTWLNDWTITTVLWCIMVFIALFHYQ